MGSVTHELQPARDWRCWVGGIRLVRCRDAPERMTEPLRPPKLVLRRPVPRLTKGGLLCLPGLGGPQVFSWAAPESGVVSVEESQRSQNDARYSGGLWALTLKNNLQIQYSTR